MTNHSMTQKNVFFYLYMIFQVYLSHIKGCRNCHYNLCLHSLFYIDAQVLTSYFCKIVELWWFGCNSIAISEAHITFWIFFIVVHCNVIRTYQKDKEERNLCRQENGLQKVFGITPAPCVIFHHFFFVNFPPPSLIRY